MCCNKGRLCWKIAKLFYFCHLKKLVRPETFWTPLRIFFSFLFFFTEHKGGDDMWIYVIASHTNSCSKPPDDSCIFSVTEPLVLKLCAGSSNVNTDIQEVHFRRETDLKLSKINCAICARSQITKRSYLKYRIFSFLNLMLCKEMISSEVRTDWHGPCSTQHRILRHSFIAKLGSVLPLARWLTQSRDLRDTDSGVGEDLSLCHWLSHYRPFEGSYSTLSPRIIMLLQG